VDQVTLDENVFNGRQKVEAQNNMFMDSESVKQCLLSVKNQKTEGMDHIPHYVLLDVVGELLNPLTGLVKLIFSERNFPDQRLVVMTTPVYKNKGNWKDIENYRPIAKPVYHVKSLLETDP
jgi:hypothetical protein